MLGIHLRSRTGSVAGDVSARWLLCMVTVMALASATTACSDGSGSGAVELPPLSVALEAEHVVPGGSITAHVEGCPSRGPIPSRSDRIQASIAPVTGGNSWGPDLDDGQVEFGSTAKYVRGESSASATPASDGSADVEFMVTTDAMSGVPLQVTVVCSSLLLLNDAGDAIDRTSVESATATSGSVAVG